LALVPGARVAGQEQPIYDPYVITTLAGMPGTPGGADIAGSANGTGTAAQFNAPFGLAVDSGGNLYVGDTANNEIRRISNGGVVTTLAGKAGSTGSADGVGSTASFNSPAGIAVGIDGTVYVADSGNDTIRKITPGGVVSTFAGTAGSAGYGDGAGGAAQFRKPSGVAVDSAGNVYVADTGNYVVRKITPGGVVSTLAGIPGTDGWIDGSAVNSKFSQLSGVAVDPNGNVFVADTGNNTVREISASGTVSTPFFPEGELNGGGGTLVDWGFGDPAPEYHEPTGVACDAAGNLYVTDSFNETIRKVVFGGTEEYYGTFGYSRTLAGTPGPTGGNVGNADGAGNAASFDYPAGIAVNSSGTIFVADVENNDIRMGVPAPPPVITVQPTGQTIHNGSTVVFTVDAPDATSYQWELNGIALSDSAAGATSDIISGSTGPQLVITNATAASDGAYTAVASNPQGSSPASSQATLSVVNTGQPASFSGISARALVGKGDNILICGVYIAGSTSRTVLIQALGPALEADPYGVTGILNHPNLTLHQTQNGQDVILASNAGWGSNPVLAAAAAAVGALPALTAGSPDSELLITLPPGGYTVEVSGADVGTGVALCAIYELP
jgi:sugar lactone lactonase YvrE